MIASDEIGRGVSLSARLRQVLLLVTSQAERSRATLVQADALLQRCSNDELNDLLHVFGHADPLSPGNGQAIDRWQLNEEFFALRDYWGEDYEISHLLDADEQGLKTHCHVVNVEIGQEFEIDDPPSTGKDAVPRQWQRIAVGGEQRIAGKVAARRVGADRDIADVDLFESTTIVRPHFMRDSENGGDVFPTPIERTVELKRWEDFDRAIGRIRDRVENVIIDTGKPSRVVYAAYSTDSRDVPIDNLDEAAIRGKAIVVAEVDRFHGGDEAGSYESPIVTNPTWLDLCILANDMIEATRDHHHVFLEDVSLDKDATNSRTDDVNVYRFKMGS